jgi:hypothetical protein
MKILAAAGLIAAASVAPAGAAGGTSAASAFAYFNGNWSCAIAMASNPGKTYPMKFTFASTPGGLETQTMTGPTSGVSVITYDPAKKQYAMVQVDNAGNYGTTISRGWNGSTMVWKDVSAAGPDNELGVQTITKQSATRWNYVYRAPKNSERITCTRS